MDRKGVGWHGSFAVIVTPFAEDGDIDEAAYREVVDLVIEDGCHGIISAGSTGEFFLMTHDERKRVFSIAVNQAGGRVPVIAGTSAFRTEDVVGLTRFAAEVGWRRRDGLATSLHKGRRTRTVGVLQQGFR